MRDFEPIALVARSEGSVHRGAQDRRRVARTAAEPAPDRNLFPQRDRVRHPQPGRGERALDKVVPRNRGVARFKARGSARPQFDAIVQRDREHHAPQGVVAVRAP